MGTLADTITPATVVKPTKSIFKSKTFVVNFIIAVVTYLVPGAQQFVRDNPNEVLLGIGLANVLLRRITHQRVALFGSDS